MRKALIVGINDYPGAPLLGCVNDANAVDQVLRRNGDGSVNFATRKLLNISNKGALRGEIANCFSEAAEIALFYFSGHGHIDAVGGNIVTPDYCEHDMGVSMSDIVSIVNSSHCQNKVVILDCCHSGQIGNIDTSNQPSTIIKEGVTLLTASKSNQPSIEINGHGMFTSLLLDALNGGAADVTGYVTPGGIYAYIDKALGPWHQRPVFKTNVTRFSPLRRVKTQVDESIIRRIVYYFDSPESEMPLDPSFEPTNKPTVEHELVEPYADANHTKVFEELQKLEGIGLVVPCEEEHMYYAAMKSKSCKLTPIGQHYWRLVHDEII